MNNKDYNSIDEVAARADQEDPIVMYLIVREGLGMSMGKTAAQCAHASQMLLLEYLDGAKDNLMEEWLKGSFRKVVLKADESEWNKVLDNIPEKGRIVVIDAGLTELDPHTATVIGVFPMRKSERPKIIKRLQTLK